MSVLENGITGIFNNEPKNKGLQKRFLMSDGTELDYIVQPFEIKKTGGYNSSTYYPGQVFRRTDDNTTHAFIGTRMEDGTTVPVFIPTEGFRLNEAREIMGEKFYGPNEIDNAYGCEMDRSYAPEFPFDGKDLKKLKHARVMYFTDSRKSGERITLDETVNLLRNKYNPVTSRLLNGLSLTGFRGKDVYSKATSLRPGWRIITDIIVPGSLNKDYLVQTQAITDYLLQYDFRDGIPEAEKKAIEEFERSKGKIMELLSSEDSYDRLTATNMLRALPINQMIRPTALELAYAGLVIFNATGQLLFKDNYIATNTQKKPGSVVYMRDAGLSISTSDGLENILTLNASHKFDNFGAVIFRGNFVT